MEERRMHIISDEEIERIAIAVTTKTRTAFFIEEESHYNSHKRIDKLLDAWDGASNIFWKTFLAMLIVGALILAGMTASKGVVK